MIAAFLFAKTQQTAVSEIRSISMTDKELRRLSRTDLLEMLLEQSKEVAALHKIEKVYPDWKQNHTVPNA